MFTISEEGFAQLLQAQVLSIWVGFQVLKNGAELRKCISQIVGIFEEITSRFSLCKEKYYREQKRDYPDLWNQCEIIQGEKGSEELAPVRVAVFRELLAGPEWFAITNLVIVGCLRVRWLY